MTPGSDGVQQPQAARSQDADERIEVQGKLTEPQFRAIHELLGQPPGRYKQGCAGPYRFGPLSAGPADAVCAYLEDILVPYQRETTRSWAPEGAGSRAGKIQGGIS